MKVEMTHMMGTDLTVVNAARVSYGKHTETLRDQDVRLIAYLAKHGHWSPFAHPQASFRISANIAVARQLFRHQVGLTVNETSRRYVTDARSLTCRTCGGRHRARGNPSRAAGNRSTMTPITVRRLSSLKLAPKS